MIEAQRKVEIKDSFKRYFIINLSPIIFIVIFIDSFVLVWFSTVIIFEGKNLIGPFLAILISFNFTFFFVIRIFIINMKPIQKTRFIISNDKIEIYLQNRLYLEFYWKDFNKIELVKEKANQSGGAIKSKGYKLNFIYPCKTKSIRLYLLVSIKKNKNIIISTIKEFSKILNKQFIEIPKLEKVEREILSLEFTKLKNFNSISS